MDWGRCSQNRIWHSSYSYSYIYNLYTVMKPTTTLDSPLNKNSLAISAWCPVSDLRVIFSFATNLSIYIYIAVTYLSCYCCDNHLSQRQMIIQAVNLLEWISSGNFTRELDKESLLNKSPIYTEHTWSVLHPHVRFISYSRPPCCIHVSWYHLPDPSTIF